MTKKPKQTHLMDFKPKPTVEQPILSPEEQKRQEKERNLTRAMDLMRESIKYLLDLTDRNSIDRSRLLILLNKVLKKMEQEGDCYLKALPDGRVRIYKKFYCCHGVDDWKRCDRAFCDLWPDFGAGCPNYSETKVESENVVNVSLNME